jgi:hypothetical protein
LYKSRLYANPLFNIHSEIAESSVSPFNYTTEPVVLNVEVDQLSMTPFINASAGFQGLARFKFSLTENVNTAYELSCSQCKEDFYATPYFDTTGYTVQKMASSLTGGMYIQWI